MVLKFVGVLITAAVLVAGCTPTPKDTMAQGADPGVAAAFEQIAQCLEAGGLPELVLEGTDVDGFPLYEFEQRTELDVGVAGEVLAGGCLDALEGAAGSYAFDDIFMYFSNLLIDVRNEVGTYRDCSLSSVCDSGAGSQYASTLETVCNDYGCFDITTKLAGVIDGDIRRGEGSSPTSLTWDPAELSQFSGAIDFANLSGLDAIGAKAAPGVVAVWGDWCADRSKMLQDPIFQNTLRYGGFFLDDSTLLVPAQATATLDDYARLGMVRQSWSGDDLPPDQDCSSWGAMLAQQSPGIKLESGLGPIVQLFDGKWATGEFLWSDEIGLADLADPQEAKYAALKLTAISDSPYEPLDLWKPWSSEHARYPALPTSKTTVNKLGKTISIHHPHLGNSDGQWQLTTSDATLCSANTTSLAGDPLFYLPHWADEMSVGGPVLDTTGTVIGTLSGEGSVAQTEVCPANVASTDRNSLGPLSNFYLDGAQLARGATFGSGVFDKIQKLGEGTPDVLAEHDFVWPTVAASQVARFEQVSWGEEFTESGFPKSELDTPAIDHLKQATLMFIKETGCTTCKESERDLDFSVPCLCTGFAVSENLIVTNDHCVSALDVGDASTFKTFYGQEVNAVLVGKTSIDGEEEFSEKFVEIYGDVFVKQPGFPQTGFHRGDVALFRTTQRMDLTPLSFAEPSSLQEYEPLITVGHPWRMSRTGPYVTAVGSFIGEHYFTRTTQFYLLPADNGASGSAVVNLKGELVGQIHGGGRMDQAETESILPRKYGLFATQLRIDKISTAPAPFSPNELIPSQTGLFSQGSTSEYILEMINKWAPGELP